METISYGGWLHCCHLSNGIIDLVITTEVGPRIIRFGFVGQPNEFREFAEMMGQTGGEAWKIYGGHRLWHAPEEKPRTYFPDNGPVTVEDHGTFVRIIQPVESTTGIQKEMDIQLVADKAQVTITHRLKNTTLWNVELAPWALSVMAQGGQAILPLPPKGSHEGNLLPAATLALWAYTNPADPRWTWGSNYVLLKQDPQATTPQKIGISGPVAWVGYARHNHLFVKRAQFVAGAQYPDNGSAIELFTNADILEVESLGPTTMIAPGSTVEHVEEWYLFADVPMPMNDKDVETAVLPKVV